MQTVATVVSDCGDDQNSGRGTARTAAANSGSAMAAGTNCPALTLMMCAPAARAS